MRTAHAGDADCPVTPHTHRNLLVNRALYHIVVVDEDGSDSRGVVAQLHHASSHKPTQLLVGVHPVSHLLPLCISYL